MSRDWDRQTHAVRSGLDRSQFDETAEALYLTSGFTYDSAEQAEASFKGEVDHYLYGRFANPTQTAFEERLRVLEEAGSCYATATGMAAVFTTLAVLLGQGSRLVCARSMFSSCYVIAAEILPRWGVETVFVDGHDIEQWGAALAEPADAVFFESPSNPMQELVDIAAVSELAHAAGATVVVDNIFATPVLQRPLELGADVVVYSTTKHIDGQGRTLGGAILGSEEFVQGPVKDFIRQTGPSIAPFNAWIALKSLETLEMRVRAMSDSAGLIAQHLERTSGIARVIFPWLESHPQHELARRQMTGGGTIVTFELEGGKESAFKCMNRLELFDISNNFGDSKSLITHPATTTHRRLTDAERAAIGIGDGTIRASIGLESSGDLVADLDAAIAAALR